MNPTTTPCPTTGHSCREDVDGCCPDCGVSMVECETCHGTGHHRPDCDEIEETT